MKLATIVAWVHNMEVHIKHDISVDVVDEEVLLSITSTQLDEFNEVPDNAMEDYTGVRMTAEEARSVSKGLRKAADFLEGLVN